MANADQVIRWFEANAGLTESPVGSNCTWISQWFWEQTDRHPALAPGCYSWCAVTVSRALNEAFGNPDVWQVPGIDADWTPGFSYVPSVRRAFEAVGRYLGQGQRGDLVIYDWDGDDIGDHIGVLVEYVGDGTVLVWEGNTGDSDISLRRRPLNLVAGFCRVPYDEQEDPLADADHIQAVVEHLERQADLADGGSAPGGQAHKEIMDRLAGVQTQLDGLKVGGGHVDLDALADAVADRIAARLKD